MTSGAESCQLSGNLTEVVNTEVVSLRTRDMLETVSTWQYNISCIQPVGQQTTLTMSAAVSSADAVEVTEALGSGKSLTPQVTTCQVDTTITLHICNIHQSTSTDHESLAQPISQLPN